MHHGQRDFRRLRRGRYKKKLGEGTFLRLAFELCLQLGVEHPSRLTLSGGELLDWAAVWGVSPWGDTRSDRRMGAATVLGMAPYLPKATTLPESAYPYFRQDDDIDYAESFEWFARYKESRHGKDNI